MSTVDERVVRMSFDNAQFQQNIQATLDSLTALNKSLKLQNAGKGLNDLGAAAKGVELGHIAQGVDAIRNKFSLMSIVGISALSNLASKAVDAGTRVIKSFTTEPITAGFKNYETQINAVQTILANTGLKGKAGLATVTTALNELNEYANKTVYSFSEMAKNIGTFTAAGVKLDVAKDAIKGIANLAALSGSNSDQASTAMYQLSQAIAANKVGLQDWNSVVNAGLGGQVFQKSLFETAQQLGTIKSTHMGQTFEEWTKAGNSFRGSLQDGWITGEVLTKTLGKFTGDLSDAQLKSQGYNDAQIKQIQELAKTAQGAAVNIKTFTQLKDALKEEVASAYSTIFKTLFGDINGATKLFTALHNVAQTALTAPIYALNKMLEGFVKLGGKAILLDTLKLGMQELKRAVDPIQKAFRDIFPATTSNTLIGLVKGLHVLVENLNISDKTVENLRRTFRGFFAIFDIAWQVIKQTAEFLGSLLGPILGKGSGNVLKVTASIGDMLVRFDQAAKKGQGLAKFFEGLRSVLGVVSNAFQAVSAVVTNFIQLVVSAVQRLNFDAIGEKLTSVALKVEDFFKNIFSNLSFGDVGNVLSAGAVGALALGIFKLVKTLRGALSGGAGFSGLISSITAPFHSLTETLESMQKTLRATTILEIAAAVGILTFAVIGLSKIDEKSLDKALQALTVLFIQLFGSLAAFNRIGGASGMVSTGAGLILIATAIRVLVSSVKGLADMSWDELKKGLASLGILMAELIVTTRLMSGQSAGMISTGVSLVILGAAIKILVSSVQDFAKMSWSEIARGLTGVGALLVSLGLFTRFAEVNKGAIAQGAGLILLGAAIKILASAVGDFAKMDWGQIAKGLASVGAILAAFAIFSRTVGNPASILASGLALIGIAYSMTIFAKAMAAFGKLSWNSVAKGLVSMGVTLGVVAAAMNAMPPGMIASAAGLVIVSYALVKMAEALKAMGGMSWGEIAKGLTVLAASLILISVAVIAMEESLPGAAALLVVSAALSILVKALQAAGTMSWEGIGKSMVVLAGAFIVFGAAGLALTPVVPTLLGLGVALIAFGAAIALIGGGIALLSFGLTGLAVSGAAGAAALGVFITAVIAQLPAIVTALGNVIIQLLKFIADATPQFVQTAIIFVTGLLTAVTTLAPKIIAALVKVIFDLLNALEHNIPGFIDKAARIILGFLEGITRNAPKVISAFVNMIVTILNSIAAKLPDFITAAVNLIVAFVNGVASQIGRVITSGANLIIAIIQGIGSNSARIIQAGADTIIKFLNSVADTLRTRTPELIEAGANIAEGLAEGIIKGLAGAVGKVVEGAVNLVKSAYHAVLDFLGINSPSKLYAEVGKNIGAGLALGLVGSNKTVLAAWGKVGGDLKKALDQTNKDITKYQFTLASLNSAKNKNPVAIYLVTAALKQAQTEYYRLNLAYRDFTANGNKTYNQLNALSKQYDKLTPKIDDANKKLADARKLRDDYVQSVKDQVDVKPDIGEDTQLADYVNNLQFKINDLKKFTDVMAKLRGLGLNDSMYKELIAKGPAALGFAEQLLAGGKDAVNNVDKLSDQLDKAAGDLGKASGNALYQAGVNAAQGIVDGLKKQQKAIEDQMSVIASALVAKLKRDLGIKSPSRVMRELGEYINKGLAGGLKDSTSDVVDAATSVGKSTLDAMGQALSGASDMLFQNTDMNPVIAPVVDLSQVRKSSGQLDAMLNGRQLNVGASFGSAKDASAGYLDNKLAAAAAVADTSSGSSPVDVTFVQNNNSPKALSSAEIYRQTNNQLSRLRGAVASAA